MPDVSNVSLLTWPFGIGVIILALRYLLPLLKTSTNSIVTQGTVSNKLLTQASEERDKALQRADAADERADRYFSELADMKTQVQLLTWQLQIANEKIDLLTTKLDKLVRGESA